MAQLQQAESAGEVAQSWVQLRAETYQTRLRQLGASANEDGTIAITAPISGTVVDGETIAGESGADAGKKVMTIINSSNSHLRICGKDHRLFFSLAISLVADRHTSGSAVALATFHASSHRPETPTCAVALRDRALSPGSDDRPGASFSLGLWHRLEFLCSCFPSDWAEFGDRRSGAVVWAGGGSGMGGVAIA
ncbi:MAG TPA: hypothetical protein V6D18_12920 [Thermosynechococcaceae cyanobacterium]